MGGSAFYLFSLYSSHLILLVDQTSRPSRQYHEENDGKKPNERWERKGMTTLDALTSLVESE